MGNLNIRQRQALLGRSWSVGVIEYILKPLTRYFPCQNRKQKPEESSSEQVSEVEYQQFTDNGDDRLGFYNSNEKNEIFCRHTEYKSPKKVDIDQSSESEQEKQSHLRNNVSVVQNKRRQHRKEHSAIRQVRNNQKKISGTHCNVRSNLESSGINGIGMNIEQESAMQHLDDHGCFSLENVVYIEERPTEDESFSGFSPVVKTENEPLNSDSEEVNIDTLNGNCATTTKDSSCARKAIGNFQREMPLSFRSPRNSHEGSNFFRKTSRNVENLLVETNDNPSEKLFTDSFSECSLGMFISVEESSYDNVALETDLLDRSECDPLSN